LSGKGGVNAKCDKVRLPKRTQEKNKNNLWRSGVSTARYRQCKFYANEDRGGRQIRKKKVRSRTTGRRKQSKGKGVGEANRKNKEPCRKSDPKTKNKIQETGNKGEQK